MKKTGTLAIETLAAMPRATLRIHPNVGFELGMMTTQHAVHWDVHGTLQAFLEGHTSNPVAGSVQLLNECPQETLQMAPSDWKNAGMPRQAVLLFDGDRLFLHPLSS
ncbi:MAG: hypothetical protein HKM06_02000 [Spirochaetales bacterium]|nr:hypothetical protein [Spirochaetales bacterium]